MTEEAKQRVETLRNVEFDDCIEFPYAAHTMIHTAADLIESLSAELEQVKRERDALMDELRGRCYSCANVKPYEKIPRMNVCEHIKVAFSGEGKRGCEYWQWRGVKEE